MAEFDLFVVGDVNPDLIVRGDGVPAIGQVERLVDEARLTLGGSSAILACGAARLGLRTAFAGVVGDDLFGRFVLEALTGRGVDVRGVVVDPERPTGVTIVLSGGAGRGSLTALGTIASMRADLLAPDLLGSTRHLHVGGYFLQRALAADLPTLFGRAREAGLTTSLDPGWDPEERWNGGLRETLAHTDVFLPNAAEAQRIAGQDGVEQAARALARLGPLVAVKLGADGGLAVRGEQVVSFPALAASVVDTTGAGDSFGAGFLAGHLRGWPLERALALGCAAGSLSTRAAGGTDAQPTMDEANEALAALSGGPAGTETGRP